MCWSKEAHLLSPYSLNFWQDQCKFLDDADDSFTGSSSMHCASAASADTCEDTCYPFVLSGSPQSGFPALEQPAMIILDVSKRLSGRSTTLPCPSPDAQSAPSLDPEVDTAPAFEIIDRIIWGR